MRSSGPSSPATSHGTEIGSGRSTGVLSLLAAIREPSLSLAVWGLVFVCTGIAVAWFRTLHLDEAAALYGFSPSALLDPVWKRPEFAADFPNGEAAVLTSLVGQIYHLLGFLPLPRRVVVGAMIFAEFSALGMSAFVCTRVVNAKLPAWTAVVTAVFLTTGALISCDLARWFHPYYGSVYNFAYSFGFAAVAAILSRKPIWAGLSLGLAATVHPIIALFFGLAVAAIGVLDRPVIRLPRLLVGGSLTVILAGAWGALMLGGAGISGDAVDPSLYIALTRLMSVHWFPISIGVFSDRAAETALPFTGMMVLIATLLRPFSPAGERRDVQIGVAIVLLLAITFIGVFASEYSGVPLLVKLALHRASLVVLLLGAIIVIPRLAAIAASGSILPAAVATLLLLLSFWRDHGPPILLCLLFAGVVLLGERRRRPRAELMLAATTIAIAVVFLMIFVLTEVVSHPFKSSDVDVESIGVSLFLAALALATVAWLFRIPAMFAAGVAIGALAWTPQVDPLHNLRELELAKAFLQVQKWARASTPTDALFMIDPSYSYSWREMSERPSFGTLREWLYSGWIYDTKASVFEEGVRRAKWLGLNLDYYLDMPKPLTAYFQMWQQAKENYNSMDAERLRDAASRYNVSYFVFERRNVVKLPALPTAFANDQYVVLTVKN